MVRTLDRTRVVNVVAQAARVFSELGLQRTQMADIARAATVSVGTLYRYAVNKETLFDLAVRHGFGQDPSFLQDAELPLDRAPPATLEFVRETLAALRVPALSQLADAAPGPDVHHEATTVVGEVFDLISDRHLGIRILDRSVREWPELSELFFVATRRPLLALLTRFLERRRDELDAAPNAATTARFLLESCAWFAMHRRYDPDEPTIDEKNARACVLRMLANGLCRRTD